MSDVQSFEPVDKAMSPAMASSASLRGLKGLISATRRYITEEEGQAGRVVRRLSEDFAYIHLQDVWNPYRFLRQMEGSPPIKLGTEGFRPELVDDHNPARHYMAFVAMGYWLPYLLALAVLYLWEIAGYIRYGFQWSPADMKNGLLGVRHGNAVRHAGIEVLPGLMVKDLAADPGEVEGSTV
ncbi:MAG: hypothetical protein IT328_09070 [Caldilineaceae bacterium]|nr:hypothetical protein [Caldilineaceae bacterium]